MVEIEGKYDDFYRTRNPEYVYPVEFVVRAFLGNYPRLKNNKAAYPGTRVSGVEISQEICDLTQARMKGLGVEVELNVGRNHSLPYDDRTFDTVLACHACYYIDPGTRFTDNLREIARVMKDGGSFVFSIPIGTSYIMRGARHLGDGHMEIANDPYGVRNGYVLKKFDSEDEIRAGLSPAFSDFEIGSCRNDFWGIEEHVWIVRCRKTA
jgi:SAM-dependent methyltransferase